eukprot:6203381-Amphidinium_carterae.3
MTVIGQAVAQQDRAHLSGTITSCWGTPLLHLNRIQSTIALSSAEAELYAMGEATREAQRIKRVIEELAIQNLSPHITMPINTDSSAGKAVASPLGLNKYKTRTIAFLVHPRHRTTWTTHHQQDTQNTQSSRRLDETPSISNKSITP